MPNPINPINERILNPLGSLSRCPREIRDKIYRLVLSKTYTAFYSSSVIKPTFYDKSDSYSLARTEYDRKERILSNLSILRLSAAIHDEAMPFLFSEGTFSFRYDFRPDHYFSNVPVHPNAEITNRMTNIYICSGTGLNSEFEQGPRFTFWPVEREYAAARSGPLRSFLGASSTRKSICIDFSVWQWPRYAVNITESPLFAALKQLTGFKTVMLRLKGRSGDCYPPQGESGEAMILDWLTFREWRPWAPNPYAGLEPLLRAMRDTLEPTLGNSSLITEPDTDMIELADYDWHIANCFEYRCIVFHPRDHLAANAKTKGD